MNSQARIDLHHEIQESRAEVYTVEIANRIPLPEDQFDRAVILNVERRAPRTNFTRRRAA